MQLMKTIAKWCGHLKHSSRRLFSHSLSSHDPRGRELELGREGLWNRTFCSGTYLMEPGMLKIFLRCNLALICPPHCGPPSNNKCQHFLQAEFLQLFSIFLCWRGENEWQQQMFHGVLPQLSHAVWLFRIDRQAIPALLKHITSLVYKVIKNHKLPCPMAILNFWWFSTLSKAGFHKLPGGLLVLR